MSEVWTKEWTETYIRRYESQPVSLKPRLARFLSSIETYDVKRRARLEELVSLTDSCGRKRLVKHLRNDDTFLTAIREITAVSTLLDSGLKLAYEMPISDRTSNKTPDWTVLDDANRHICIIEVTHCNPSDDVNKAERSFDRLFGHLGEYTANSNMCVHMSPSDTLATLTEEQIQDCCTQVVLWLEQKCPQEGEELCIYDVVFRAAPKPFPSAGIAPSAGGYNARKQEIHISSAMRVKAEKYRNVCKEHQVPLVVVIHAHYLTCLNSEIWTNAICGATIPVPNDSPMIELPAQIKTDSVFGREHILSAAGWLLLDSDGWHVNWLLNRHALNPIDPSILLVQD